MIHFTLQLSSHTLSLRKIRIETPGRNLEARGEAEATRNAAYGLPPHSFLGLLSYSAQDHQFMECATCNRLGPPTSIARKKMPRGFVYRLIWCECFLNCSSFFSTSSDLWQTDKRPTRAKHFPISQIKLHVKNTLYIKLVSQHIASKLTTNMWEFSLHSYPQSILFHFKRTLAVPKCTPCQDD